MSPKRSRISTRKNSRVTNDSLAKRVKELNDIKIGSVEIDDMNEALKNHEALRAAQFQELERKKLEAAAPPPVKLLEAARLPE